MDVNESFETAKEVLPPKDARTTIFGNGESFVGNLKQYVANNSGFRLVNVLFRLGIHFESSGNQRKFRSETSDNMES